MERVRHVSQLDDAEASSGRPGRSDADRRVCSAAGGIWDRGDGGAGWAITQEVLSLNLFWIFAAIEAHIPQKYQAALSELILDAMEAGWGTTVPVGSAAWTAYLNEWQERRRRYSRLVEEGVSPLAVSAEAAELMEENHLVKEEERRNLLTLLIDFVPVDTYGQLLEDVG